VLVNSASTPKEKRHRYRPTSLSSSMGADHCRSVAGKVTKGAPFRRRGSPRIGITRIFPYRAQPPVPSRRVWENPMNARLGRYPEFGCGKEMSGPSLTKAKGSMGPIRQFPLFPVPIFGFTFSRLSARKFSLMEWVSS